jgi:hypothetical protein
MKVVKAFKRHKKNNKRLIRSLEVFESDHINKETTY